MQSVAWCLAEIRPTIPNFQLGTLCEAAGLGWDESLAHDALYDVRKTIDIFKDLI